MSSGLPGGASRFPASVPFSPWKELDIIFQDTLEQTGELGQQLEDPVVRRFLRELETGLMRSMKRERDSESCYDAWQLLYQFIGDAW